MKTSSWGWEILVVILGIGILGNALLGSLDWFSMQVGRCVIDFFVIGSIVFLCMVIERQLANVKSRKNAIEQDYVFYGARDLWTGELITLCTFHRELTASEEERLVQ
jgi:hypothetical protein